MYRENLMFGEDESRSLFVCERPLPCEQLWIVPFPLPFSEILSRGGGYNRGVIGSKMRGDHCEGLDSQDVDWRT